MEIEEIIYTFFYVLLCQMFVQVFTSRKKQMKKNTMMLWIIVLTIMDYSMSFVFENDFIMKQTAIIIVGATVMWLCYQLKYVMSILFVLFYQGLCFATDYIAWMLQRKMFVSTNIDSPVLIFLMGTLSQFLVFCFILVLRYHFVSEDVNNLTDFEWAKFAVFPAFSMLIIIALLVNFENIRNERQINTLIFLAFGILLLNIFAFYLLRDAVEREGEMGRQRLQMERANSEMKMYQQISENYNQQKKREHEYKNQIMIIESLFRKQENQKLELLLGQYSREIAHHADIIDTNHVIVNAVLNTKHQEAKEKGILFVLKVNCLSDLKLEDRDIVIILSNLLNNAIEANEGLTGKRIIWIKVVQERGRTIFSVINTIQKLPNCVAGRYRTTKEGILHGVGIDNVKDVVAKYGGTCAIRHDKEKFYFVIYIPD